MARSSKTIDPETLMTLGKTKSLLCRLWAMPRQRQVLLLDGALALLVATWKVRLWPFSRLAASLGTASAPHSLAGPAVSADLFTPNDLMRALEVRWAIAAWTKVWPLQPTCLIQAVAARHLCVAQSLPCQLFFGVRGQSPKLDQFAQHVGAHAWLRSVGTILTGDSEAARFQPIAVYCFTPSTLVKTP